MNTILINLIIKAFETHGTDIMPCGRKPKFRDCVSVVNIKEKSITILWYDTPDGSTHIVQITTQKKASE